MEKDTTIAEPRHLDGSLFGEGQPCFGCAPDHPFGFHLRFTQTDDEVSTRFTPGPQYQGPLGIMHGGLVMTLADEVAAWAIIALRGKFGFTAKFSGQYLAPVRIEQEMEARARILKDGGRLFDIGVDIHQSGVHVFRCEMRFVVLDRAGAEKLLQRPLPESWERFCR